MEWQLLWVLIIFPAILILTWNIVKIHILGIKPISKSDSRPYVIRRCSRKRK